MFIHAEISEEIGRLVRTFHFGPKTTSQPTLLRLRSSFEL